MLELHGVSITSAWLVHVDVVGSRLGCTELFFQETETSSEVLGGGGLQLLVRQKSILIFPEPFSFRGGWVIVKNHHFFF